MSTDLHIHCLTHGDVSDECGRATDAQIALIRDKINRRVEIADIWHKANEEFEINHFPHWDTTLNTAFRFVVNHSECSLALLDEYNRHYDLSEDPTECFAWISLGDIRLRCDLDAVNGHTGHHVDATDDRGVEFHTHWSAFDDRVKR